MRVEEQYMDVLQNIESAIVQTYRQYPRMSDYDVMRAIEALMDAYVAEKIGRAPRKLGLGEADGLAMEKMRAACDWRMGREVPPAELPNEISLGSKPLTIDETMLCLKRILKSVKMWNKEGGSQGYLHFIAQYVG